MKIVIIVFLLFMGLKYEKIEFKNFSGGQEQEFLEVENNFYKVSDLEIKNDTKKIKLLGALTGTAIPRTIADIDDYTIAPDRAVGTNEMMMILVSDDVTGRSYLYTSIDGINFVNKYTFSATIGSTEGKIFAKNNKIICFFASGYIAISNDGGTSFTETASAFYPSGNLEIINDSLGYVGSQNIGQALYKTTNFLTYTLLYDINDGDEEIIDIKRFDNTDFFVLDNKLYRLENDIPIIVKTFPTTNRIFMHANKNYIIIGYFANINKIKIVFYDGGEFTNEKEIKTSDNFAYFKFLCSTDNETVFVIRQSGATPKEEIYKINNEKAVFKLFSFSHAQSSYTDKGTIVKEKYIFAVISQAAPLSYKLYTDSVYSASGNLETSIISKGEIRPKQITLKHKPLEIGTSVKIYCKKNYASSWGAAILESNTVGAIKKKYNFIDNAIYDYIQFKIELITTDTSKTPEDIELELLYLPVGLENAK